MMDRFSGVSSPAWISAVHPTILVSESPDWHLFRFSCLLCPIAANVAPKKRQVQKADLRITFGIPCSRIGTNTTVQSLSPPSTFQLSVVRIQRRRLSECGSIVANLESSGSG